MIRFFEEGGPLRVYKMPDVQGVYVIGADVAFGVTDGDYSCAHVIDARSGQQCAVWHDRIRPDEFGYELSMLGYFYNAALIGVESNNHGISTVDYLRHASYPRLYRDRKVDDITRKVDVRYGFKTDQKSRPLILDELAAAIKGHELMVYDKPTIQECLTFIRNEKGKLEGQPHDDRVMSLAIGWHMLQHAGIGNPLVKPDDRWSLDWWARLDQKPTALAPIGANNARRR